MAISEIPTCLTTCAFSPEFGNQSWTLLIGGIIITVALALSVGYMISRALNKREWEAKIRMETYYLIIAVIWFMIISAVANLTCSLSCSITHGESPFMSAKEYTASVKSELESFSNQLLEKAKNIRIESAVAMQILDVQIMPEAGCENIASTYENFAFMLTPFIASMIVQEYALILISQIAFQFLLPLGIVLKLVPGLRDSASYVIGIAFALYIVLPLTYVLAEKSTESIAINSISTNAGGDCVSVDAVSDIMQGIGGLLPQAVFFPALSSIITIGAARAFAEIFKYDFAELRGE